MLTPIVAKSVGVKLNTLNAIAVVILNDWLDEDVLTKLFCGFQTYVDVEPFGVKYILK